MVRLGTPDDRPALPVGVYLIEVRETGGYTLSLVTGDEIYGYQRSFTAPGLDVWRRAEHEASVARMLAMLDDDGGG